jgi:hypothetical protein
VFQGLRVESHTHMKARAITSQLANLLATGSQVVVGLPNLLGHPLVLLGKAVCHPAGKWTLRWTVAEKFLQIAGITLTRFSAKGRPLMTASWARLTFAADTNFMASVIFCVFLTLTMRSRVSLSDATTCVNLLLLSCPSQSSTSLGQTITPESVEERYYEQCSLTCRFFLWTGADRLPVAKATSPNAWLRRTVGF